MRVFGIFLVGLLLVIAGMNGNPGSMLGAIIDPANMQEIAQTLSPSAAAPGTIGSVMGGL